jgi:CBS domain-containing protein
MIKEIFDYLSARPYFSILSDDEMREVAAGASLKTVEKGTVFAVKDRTEVDSIYVIQSGELSLYDEKDGQRVLIGHIKQGEVFGGITILMNGGISLRTAIAEKDCTGYTISKTIFLDICKRNKAFYEYFLENFSNNIFDDSLASIIETGQIRVFLANTDPFSFLPEGEIEQIAGELSLVHHPKNSVLYVQARSRVGYLYILQKGSAERYFEETGRKKMIALLGEGDIYGGISILLNDGISVRTLRVVEDSYFYLLSKDTFLRLCDTYETFSDYFTDAFGKRMLEKSYAAVIAKTMQVSEEGLPFFNQPVSSIYSKKPVFGDMRMSIRETAQIMSTENISSLFLTCPEGKCRGVVTEKDLTKKVIATGVDISRPVSDVMTSPVRTIPRQALIFEACMIMMQEDIRHLGITDNDDKIVSIISNRDILTAQGQSPIFLIREISAAKNMEEIIDRHDKLPRQIKSLISSVATAKNLTRFITTVSDTILKRILGFTLESLGTPPARFVFMVLGSEGRREQTLKTDQDNAIVYEDVSAASEPAVQSYFLKFGEMACNLLNEAGYAFCTGGVMAKNPKWCRPLSAWKRYFSKWIHAAEAEDLLQASIFFDFNGAYGDMALIDNLRKHLFASLEGWSGFFRHLTENAIYFKPPIGFFRNFVVESKGEHRNKFDIKSAMTPIVDFARTYALKNKIEETNTLERLYQLQIKNVLKRGEYEELEKAYSFLLQLRFVRQVTAMVDESSQPDNYINPKKLTRIEQKMLKEIFSRIENFQSKLEVEFIGAR